MLNFAALASSGLNLVGIADGTSYQTWLPGCRSVVVLASAGPTLWEAMLADLRLHPTHLSEEAHPFDAFVQRTLHAFDPAPPPSRRWVRCAADEGHTLDFRTLALNAGIGWGSRLGLLLHPTFGPWMGLRAACFTTEPLTPTGPLAEASPCETCPAPCIAACPAGALARGKMDIQRCSSWHSESTTCDDTCHSRLACPVGTDFRYPEAELLYHYNRSLGRKNLAASLGIDDAQEGVGPFWKAWAK